MVFGAVVAAMDDLTFDLVCVKKRQGYRSLNQCVGLGERRVENGTFDVV